MGEKQIKSAVDVACFPAVQSGRVAELMALQRQFDESQYWPQERMQAMQFAQLSLLVRHAARQVPFYAARFKACGLNPERAITPALWRRLPILTREDVQRLGAQLHAANVPAACGAISLATSGGSSGVPVRVRKSALDTLFWQAHTVREEIWHRDFMQGTIARLRGVPDDLPPEQASAVRSKDGLVLPDWGPPAAAIWKTGKIGLISPAQPVAVQAKFLQKLQPDYLFTFPSYLRLLLAHLRESGRKLGGLRAVWVASEVVDAGLREDCQAILGCKIVENYTSGETGYIALQCPTSTQLHVQAETVLVEILDAAGKACAPGEMGRVVVTPLHNFAMPLLRYEIGDEAIVGAGCGCGRHLPLLERVVGRSQDYLLLPGGERRRVDLNHYRLSALVPVREFQLVQHSVHEVELRLAVSRPLDAAETEQLGSVTQRLAGGVFAVRVTYHEALERTAAGKLRPFISLM